MPSALRLAAALVAALLVAAPSPAAEPVRLHFEVAAGNVDRSGLPVRVLLEVPAAARELTAAAVATSAGEVCVGQVAPPSLLSPEQSADRASLRELCFVPRQMPAGKSLACSVTLSPADSAASQPRFSWRDAPGQRAECLWEGRPLLSYEYRPLDESSPDRRAETYKVFHHVYDPTGAVLLTKGPGGLYPHHRGIFYGFNKITYGAGRAADVWHCSQGAYQSHGARGPLDLSAAGPVFARHCVDVLWHGQDGQPFAAEERELTLLRLSRAGQEALVVDFASRLVPQVDGPLRLDGDPQHAGFQFRAPQEVAAQTKGQTYYLRPGGPGQPGDYRNWPQDPSQVNLPWKAMSFVVSGQRYTVAYLDHPQNPKEARFSERDYGRFGSYFVAEPTAAAPLEVRYRLWIQAGEMTVDQVSALAADFASPAVRSALP